MDDDREERRDAAMRANYAQTSNLQARQSIFAYSSMRDGDPTVPELIRLPPGQALLDVGCGNGLWLETARQQSAAELAVGVDLSLGMVQGVRARSQDVPVAQGDVVALPFTDGAFDAVFALWMLYHVANKATALSEIRRVLRPGGRLVAATNASGGDDALDDLVRGAIEATIGTRVDQWIERLDFDADNGYDILAAEFGRVDRHLLRRDFAVPESAPLVAFVDSLRTPIEAELGVLPWLQLLGEFEGLVKARLRSGPIEYHTVQCVFVCH